MKAFDRCKEKKKAIHVGGQGKLRREREIRWRALGVNIGFEQDGTGAGYGRRILILISDHGGSACAAAT